MSNQTITLDAERPDLKSRQPKWSWPRLVSVHDKASGSKSSNRPRSLRTASGESQRPPGVNEYKTPSQTLLPLSPTSPIHNETSSTKSTNLADSFSPKVDQLSEDVHGPSWSSSSSSGSTSSGHRTIRAEEPESEQILQKAKQPQLKEQLINEEGSESTGILKSQDLPQGKLPKEGQWNSEAEIPTGQDVYAEGELQRKQESEPVGRMRGDHDLNSEGELPRMEELGSEGKIQQGLDPYPEGKSSTEGVSGFEGGTQRGYNLYLEVRLQESKKSCSEQSKAAEESSLESRVQSAEEPHLEEELQRVGTEDLKEKSQQVSDYNSAKDNQPNAREFPQEHIESVIGSSEPQDPDPRNVDACEHKDIPFERLPVLPSEAASSQNFEPPEVHPEPVIVTAVIELPKPSAKSTKGRKIQIPKIFIENPSEGRDINIPNSTLKESVSKELPQDEARDIDTPNTSPKAYDIPIPTPNASISEKLPQGEAREDNISDSIPQVSDVSNPTPKVSVFKELSQDEPWWLGPPTPKVGSKEQDKPWPLGPSMTKPPMHVTSASDPSKIQPEAPEAGAPPKSPTNDEKSGESSIKRRKLYLRKARNAAARKVILQVTLGRQLAKQTKPALRRLAKGETIAPSPQS